MKQLTVISGKGGTGKTTVTASFAALAENAVLADCDVDAADLHLILKPEVISTHDFFGLKLAHIDYDLCTRCGQCVRHCRFDAIDDDINIIADRCEGCGVCQFVCPVDAISMKERLSGHSHISSTRFGPMAHARLFTAEEASGKLVAVVRNNARILAYEQKRGIIIIDGPPGIGCPVISAISGVDICLIVTEPSLSGMHDLERVLEVTAHFKIPSLVCINKCDINPDNSAKIKSFCKEAGVGVVGELVYDRSVTQAQIKGLSVVEYDDGEVSQSLKAMWNRIMEILDQIK